MTGANGAPGASRASGPTGGTGATRTTALTGLTRLTEAVERLPQRLRRLRAALPGDDILGALLLLAATLLALLWANLGGTTYDDFWHTHLTVTLGAMELDLSLQHWVNDGLMALFFLMVSLEVKRDFVMGELRQWRRASVPVIAAVAGLVVPALLFLLLNAPGPVAHAWGIVISTDTAFVIGLLAVFGDRVPVQLRAFLVALAVVDDVGALLVIAFVYTDTLNAAGFIGAAVVCGVVYLVQRMRAWRARTYVLVGAVLWLAVLVSGVHATIAGVLLGLLLPVYPPTRESIRRAEELTQVFRRTPQARTGRDAADGVLSSVSVNDRFQLGLGPVVAFFVVPVFALANAGVLITGESLARAFTSPLTWGIILGLVVGKFVGVLGATVLATRLRLGELSTSVHIRHVASGAMLTGIGFTISLFIVELALDDPAAQSDARIGVLTASLIAGLLGMAALALTARYDAAHAPDRVRLSRPVDPGRDHIAGDPGAPMTLVEYGRFGDPAGAMGSEVVGEVLEQLGDSVSYVFRHNTLGDLIAYQAAQAIEAVADQSPDLFWAMREELDRACIDATVDLREIRRAAVIVGANRARMEEDLRRGRWRARVDDDDMDARSMGLATVPRFFVNGVLYSGPVDTDGLVRALEETRGSDDPATEGRTA